LEKTGGRTKLWRGKKAELGEAFLREIEFSQMRERRYSKEGIFVTGKRTKG